MTQYEREQIERVIGMLNTLEYIIREPDGAGEAVTEANDVLKEVLDSEDKTAS